MPNSALLLTIQDLRDGLAHWRIWVLLGWQDIRIRYRRSVIGPFWITLSTGVMVATMGFLYGTLFKIELTTYYPYLASGLIVWTYISTLICEGVDAFTSNAHFIKQIKLPYTVYPLRLFVKNNIIFFHNLLVFVPIAVIFHLHSSIVYSIILLMNIVLLNLTFFPFVFILCILGTRYLDFKQITLSLITILFLLTPIMWMPSMLPERMDYLAEYNPIFQWVNLIREPMTGHLPDPFTYVYLLIFGLTGYFLMFLLLWRTRHRIAFWV
jgi:lipopolysaccharide transport system permease protein